MKIQSDFSSQRLYLLLAGSIFFAWRMIASDVLLGPLWISFWILAGVILTWITDKKRIEIWKNGYTIKVFNKVNQYEWDELYVRSYMILAPVQVYTNIQLKSGVVFSPLPIRIHKNGKVKKYGENTHYLTDAIIYLDTEMINVNEIKTKQRKRYEKGYHVLDYMIFQDMVNAWEIPIQEI